MTFIKSISERNLIDDQQSGESSKFCSFNFILPHQFTILHKNSKSCRLSHILLDIEGHVRKNGTEATAIFNVTTSGMSQPICISVLIILIQLLIVLWVIFILRFWRNFWKINLVIVNSIVVHATKMFNEFKVYLFEVSCINMFSQNVKTWIGVKMLKEWESSVT